MKKILFINVRCLLFVLCLYQLSTIQAQRQMEKLDRGLVAVKVNNGVFLSWRVFGTDPKEVAFNIYRNGTKVNTSPITGATNMVDASGTTNSSYSVRAIIGGQEQAADGAVTVWGSQVKTVNLSNRPSGNHAPNDINVGDLDGDGQYELIVKWYPNNAKDNSQSGVTDNTYLGAYKLDGTFLWMIDLGRNIRSGAHYTQHLVGDYDSDGFAEVACKTAPNTKDGKGNFLSKGPASNDNDNADYRNGSGYVLSGPEYLTIFNGRTGEEMATISYVPQRGNVGSWGDTYGNRLDRYNATNAYFDGKHPSMLFQRGYYTRMTMMAMDWDGQNFITRWIFDSNNSGSSGAYGQGNHSIMTADIDNDGFDEILTGSVCIDHDGKLKWRTGYGHGDANHVGDFDLSSPGLEIWQVSENKGSEPDHYMIRGSDGTVLWGNGSGNDNGRCMIGDIDASRSGQEAWSARVGGTFTGDGNNYTNAKPSSMNFRVYWDGDLQDELLNNNVIDKWNGNSASRVINLTGESCNGTKATPNISADLLGDWREEVILHDGGSNIYIHTTTLSTQHKLYTLMHDPVYRNAISWQQSSYNQPPHLGFFLGAGVDKAPTPNIVLVGGTDCNGVNGGGAYLDDCGTCVGGNTGKEACIIDCNGDINGTASLDDCGVCTGGSTGVAACKGVIQGESFCTANGVLEATNAGFQGNGYLNFDNATDTKALWTLVSEETQTVQMTVRYANGGAAARGLRVLVNGSQQPNIVANTTASWTEWQTETVTINLTTGVNTLEMIALTAEGGPNLDLISFSEDNISKGSCDEDCNGVFGGLASVDNCNVCSGGNTGVEPCEQDCNGNWGGTAVLDNCGVCVGGNSNVLPCTGTVEAENPCTIDGVGLENTNTGYTGDGYVNTTNTQGAYVSWLFDATSAQTVTLTFRYANGGGTSRDGDVKVNNVSVGTLLMPSTSGWGNWSLTSINVPVVVGKNEILIEAITADGIANIDLIHHSEGITDAYCIVTNVNPSMVNEFGVYPNPTSSWIHFSNDYNWELYNAYGVLLQTGLGHELSLEDYSSGTYFVKVNGEIVSVIKE